MPQEQLAKESMHFWEVSPSCKGDVLWVSGQPELPQRGQQLQEDPGLPRALDHDTVLVCALSGGLAFSLQASA